MVEASEEGIAGKCVESPRQTHIVMQGNQSQSTADVTIETRCRPCRALLLVLPIAASVYLLLWRLFGGGLLLHCRSCGSLFHADPGTATPLQYSCCCGASSFFFQVPVSLAADVVELKRMLVLPRRFSAAAASAPLSLCICYCVAAAVVDFILLLVLPCCFSVAAAVAHLHFFFKFLCRWQLL